MDSLMNLATPLINQKGLDKMLSENENLKEIPTTQLIE